ncbi:uncharacterized serine-rich protein-like protein [Tanacetum coccineum]
MGGCLSSVGGDSVTVRTSNNSAFVISPKGDLRPYSTPVFVSEVLDQMEEPSFFVCNSDNLSYDQHIHALDAQHELDAGQIYFVLPISKLRDRLSASEMAALAVKASVALNSKASSSSKSSKGYSQQKRSNSYKKKSKISPFVVMETSKINVIIDEEAADRVMLDQKQQQSSSLGVSRSGSIRKMQRYSSRKARLAVRSFRLRLSTIHEAESTSDQSHSHKLY